MAYLSIGHDSQQMGSQKDPKKKKGVSNQMNARPKWDSVSGLGQKNKNPLSQ